MANKAEADKINDIFSNRIQAVMAHTTRYAFRGESRLAFDAGISRSAINRLLNGINCPTLFSFYRVLWALEKHSGRKIDPRELISFEGTYPTSSVCDLMGCRGCSFKGGRPAGSKR